MFNKSIAYRLSIYISLSVVGVFMAFIIAIFFYNQRIVQKSIDSVANNYSIEAISMVKRQLISTQEIAQNLSEQVIYYAEHGNTEVILTSIMERYPFLNSIYVSIDSLEEITFIGDNHFLISRSANSLSFESGREKIYHNILDQEIYKALEINDSSLWSSVYQHNDLKSQIVSFYTPLKLIQSGNQNKIGAVICELSLNSLNKTINDIKIGENGYAFLIKNDGVYLTHPNRDWVFNKNIFSIPEKSLDTNKTDINNILDKNLSGSIIAYPEYLNYEKCWVHYTPIIETGWFLIVLIPYDELYFPLYILILRMLFFSVLGILLIFFIVTLISNKQIQPLSNVTSQLKRFSSLLEKNEQSTLNEVEIVAESLVSLKDWFEKYRNTQYQEQKLSNQQKQDLQEASEIQMSLIKSDFSEFEKRKDIDLYARYRPSRIVSGDLFDSFFLDADHLIFTIGDVSGKGISAAFFMSVAQTIIKGNSNLREPEKIVAQVNNELTTANQHQFFLTLFIGVLNVKTGLLKYCNAAHTSAIILKQNGKIEELNYSHGMPLGLYSEKLYSGAKIKIEQNDVIFLYTDGVTELQNENKIHYGKEKLVDVLGSVVLKSSKEIIESVELSLEDFRGKTRQSDDITMMAIKFKAKKRPD